MRSHFFVILALFFLHTVQGQISIDPDDTEQARSLLYQLRDSLLADTRLTNAQKANRMMDLGMWEAAYSYLEISGDLDYKQDLARVRYLILHNQFVAADTQLQDVLARVPDDIDGKLLEVELNIHAWDLDQAEKNCLAILKNDPNHQASVLWLGRVHMLKKNYPKALALAEQVQHWDSLNAEAWLLAAEVFLWQREAEKAEAALQQSLRINPYLADARFNYGYAIWRRVDATQLPAMAAQWELALEINPLHYHTHWHWGNGHTHLTYADYLDPDEAEILAALRPADSLIQLNRMDQAIDHCRITEAVYFASVIPAMYRASAFYMDYTGDRMVKLDSATKIFQDILRKKSHYGPAHNGLAAVIKQQRFPYLMMYDSLDQVIQQTEIQDPDNFYQVFPDMNYYPGDQVQKMIWNQLYDAVVYFPFLSKQELEFVIPPLHVDLATAMENPWFRGATTFDNRQWMDIRGVGSGATAIEYVARGAFLERNVTLHEYVHLFHGRVFNDQEMRRVRALYYQAMEKGLTLDYYSANNEFEYLAQTYPAYFIPIKVHPLNHKSVNIKSELARKDPDLYAFLDSLVQRQRAYLAGDKQAMATNWAQVYLNLAEESRDADIGKHYLDSAFHWDSTYLPIYIQYADYYAKARQFNKAEQWLQKALEKPGAHGPIYSAFVKLTESQYRLGRLDIVEAYSRCEAYFESASQVEKDLAERAQMNRNYRQFHLRYAHIQEAIEKAESYVASAPTVSTYLRDRKDEAAAFAWELKGLLGYQEGANLFFQDLIARKPQHYHHRAEFARVLLANEQWDSCISVLQSAQLILEAAGTPSPEFAGMMALAYLAKGDSLTANKLLGPILEESWEEKGDPFLWVEVFLQSGQNLKAMDRFARIKFPAFPAAQADYLFAKGRIAQYEQDISTARMAFEQALGQNPYHMAARLALMELLQEQGEKRQLRKLASKGDLLPIPPGPALQKKLDSYQDTN